MTKLILDDSREFIFPLLLVDGDSKAVTLESYVFLGTGFFVTKRGDAITARHVIPRPEDIPPGKCLVALVRQDGKDIACLITRSMQFHSYDLAIFHVNLPVTRFLEVTDGDVIGGMDVQLIGIPSHERRGAGKEMRLLKGHVTFVSDELELNIAVPKGMSGCPVFVGTRVVGWATGYARSEEIVEQREEIVEVTEAKERIEISTTSRIIYYGTAIAFARLRGQAWAEFEGKTLMQLIQSRNTGD
ncbi:serine protease [Paraburkholderia sp. EG287A]|uniref:serine protease n=1 Tax=Paraburkholderia sp. EG287A TaxID=3237012 RepID=UPI0034D2FEED